MARKKKTIPELKVVFDTSVLFSQVAYDLLRSEVRQLIENNSQHVDLKIRWYLPSIVVDERRYQMQTKALELLPSIEKLERLLGHNLNITEEILKHRVDEAIDRQLTELGLSTVDIDTTEIKWKNLIQRAVYRQPPFEPGEKEKGFRDSLIAETFLQLVKQSPATPSICRLAVVTADGLLAAFVKESTKEARNVRVLSNTSELESLINTLVSQVTEEFVADLSEKARKYFFEKENDASLYYKEHIRDKIMESYGQELGDIPKEGLLRENGTWLISVPVFVKKERQRVFWITPIDVEAKLSKYEYPEPPTLPSLGLKQPSTGVEQRYGLRGFGLLTDSPKKVEVASGQSSFEIHWSVNITQSKKLTSPSIDKIQFISTKWGEE